MKTLLNIIFFFTPSFIQVPLRRLTGQKIGKGSKIKIGTFFSGKNVEIGRNVKIGPFCFVKGKDISIGDNSNIKSLSVLSTRIIRFGQYVHIAPLSIISSEFTENSLIEIGDHSRLFPFCWLDTGDGISIGKNVGIGGHTLIFTHGVWANYLDGGPVSFGPVKIEDNVWLPWRIFVLPNVTIGKDSIVGANSLVNRSFPENVLIGGNPAKLIKENIKNNLNIQEVNNRIEEILFSFSSYYEFKKHKKIQYGSNQIDFGDFKIIVDNDEIAQNGDLLFVLTTERSEEEIKDLLDRGVSVIDHFTKVAQKVSHKEEFVLFISYLRKFGIRLYIN